MTNVLVSIVTPAYNCSEFIERTYKTVLGQTYKNWEWIVVDDCSNDDTVAKLESFVDCRVKCFKLEENSGPAVARNLGIKEAGGEIIAFLDSDDLWDSHKIELQIEFMKKRNYGFTFHWHRKVDEGLIPFKEFKPPTTLNQKILTRYNPLHTSSVMYDVRQFGKIYMPEIRKRQDYGLWFKLCEIQDGYCLKSFLSSYVSRPGSVSSNKLDLFKYHWELYRKHFGFSLFKSIYCVCWVVFTKITGIK